MHDPVGEAADRGGGHRRPEGVVGATHRAPAGQERGAEAHNREQRADQTRLGEGAQLDAMGIARGLFAVAEPEVLLLEVVDADPEHRMSRELVERDPVEVVTVASQATQQATADRSGRRIAAFEAFPAMAHALDRVAGRQETAGHDRYERREGKHGQAATHTGGERR
jgi:hypothetical protein